MSEQAHLATVAMWTRGSFSLHVDAKLTAPWTVLFGPSGAGKSSLLRLIAGLTRPDRGWVLLGGKAVVDTDEGIWEKPGKRGVGLVSQRPALFPHMNVTSNVAFSLHRLDRRARAARVAEMLALFAATHLAGKRPAQLSGGEKQRVALARALAPEPRLLLLDEPFTGLEEKLKHDLMNALREWLAPRGIPVILVTHDVAEAFYGDEVVIMESGRITAQGRPAEVLDRERQKLLAHLASR